MLLVGEHALVAAVLLRMMPLKEVVDVHLEDVGGHDLVVAAQADEGRAAHLVQEELAFVPPELPAQRVVDRDFLWSTTHGDGVIRVKG